MWKIKFNPILIKQHARWSIILRLVMTMSLLSPFLHVHHLHAAELVVAGINILQVVEDNDQGAHHHDEPKSSQSSDHSHTFVNHTDWKLFRPQSNNSSISDNEFVGPNGKDLWNRQRPITRFHLVERPILGVIKVFTSKIRGPPTLS